MEGFSDKPFHSVFRCDFVFRVQYSASALLDFLSAIRIIPSEYVVLTDDGLVF